MAVGAAPQPVTRCTPGMKFVVPRALCSSKLRYTAARLLCLNRTTFHACAQLQTTAYRCPCGLPSLQDRRRLLALEGERLAAARGGASINALDTEGEPGDGQVGVRGPDGKEQAGGGGGVLEPKGGLRLAHPNSACRRGFPTASSWCGYSTRD